MKNRLTYRDENGRAYFTNANLEDCAERLAAYEDLGVTPEQLIEIDKLYTKLCEEIAELRKREDDGK